MKRIVQRRTKRSTNFRPRLEALEDRWCPAVTMSVVEGHILEVLGDRGDNVIAFNIQGAQVSLTGDDSPMATFTGIDAIRLNTWAGRDNVRLTVETPPPDPDFSFTADLGAGNDIFTLIVPPPDPDQPPPAPDFQPNLSVVVQGGSGDDAFVTFVGMTTDPESIPFPSCINATLMFNFEGDVGDDRFFTDVANVSLNGPINMTTAGGQGDDTFRTTFGNVAINAPLTLMNDGGLGADDIAVICGFNPQPDPPAMPGFVVNAPVAMLLDGGLGGDNIAAICGFNPQPDPPAFPAMQVLSNFQLGERGGDGDDQMDFAARWQVGAGATTSVSLMGDGGSDRMGLTAVNHIAASARSTYAMDGGEGDDALAFSYVNAIVAGAFQLNMNGGSGNDNLFGRLNPVLQRGGSAAATFDGGDGNDVIVVDVPPGPCEPGSLFGLSVLGGQGDDVVVVQVNLLGYTPESGRLQVAVSGDGGSDHLALLAPGAERPMENILLALDGGFGEDFAVASFLVHVMNCEHLQGG